MGRIEARESESEAVAKGSVVEQGTTASCSSDDLDSGFSVIWVLGSIFASEKGVEDKLTGVFYLWFGLLSPSPYCLILCVCVSIFCSWWALELLGGFKALLSSIV